MSAKKKTAPKKKTAAKKAAKVMADVMDSIIETVADYSGVTAIDPAWMNVDVQPVDTVQPGSTYEVFDEDDYNPYAPKGFGGSWEKEAKEAKLDREMQGIIMPPDEPEPQPVPVEKPSLPLPAPAGRVVEALVKHAVAIRSVMPPSEIYGDALVVQRLVNAINYLYPIARLTKGQKGPQPADIKKVQENIVKARNLITRLS